MRNLGEPLIINPSFIRSRIIELGLKQWWIAERIGVDRKTVIRWTSGKVRAIQEENAQALARILKCPVSRLLVSDRSELFATVEDQKEAARVLAGSGVISTLAPKGEWKAIEALLRASLVPDLPAAVLGRVYNELAVASWRQSRIGQAETYARKALALGEKLKDTETVVGASLSLANIHSWRGEIAEAVKKYRWCIDRERFIRDKRLFGAALSNLGAVCYEAGDLKAAARYQLRSLDVFRKHGKPMNLSISHAHLAFVSLERGRLDSAGEHIEKSLRFAEKADYKRGLMIGKLLGAELLARRGGTAEACREAEAALAGFSALGIEEGLNYEIGARVMRLAGRKAAARRLLDRGLPLAEEFPMEKAALHREYHALTGAKKHRDAARDIYARAGAKTRAHALSR